MIILCLRAARSASYCNYKFSSDGFLELLFIINNISAKCDFCDMIMGSIINAKKVFTFVAKNTYVCDPLTDLSRFS